MCKQLKWNEERITRFRIQYELDFIIKNGCPCYNDFLYNYFSVIFYYLMFFVKFFLFFLKYKLFTKRERVMEIVTQVSNNTWRIVITRGIFYSISNISSSFSLVGCKRKKKDK